MKQRPGSQGPGVEPGWPAPGKLNLFLHITGRRADGYHELQTVFQFLDYGDTLFFRLRDDGVIRQIGALPGVAPENDLTVRAAHLLQSQLPHRGAGGPGVDIRLEKRLPLGGGLGGGSSDAATVLVALNRLWGLRYSWHTLVKLGQRLGADVPVFIHGHAAWAEGTGEDLTDIELPEPWYLVINPQSPVSTTEIFAAPDLTRDCMPLTIRDFLAGMGDNICEPVVRARYPEVAEALDWLSEFSPARMTGTGSCVFAAFREETEAYRVRQQVPGQWNSFVAHGRNISPLMEITDSE